MKIEKIILLSNKNKFEKFYFMFTKCRHSRNTKF